MTPVNEESVKRDARLVHERLLTVPLTVVEDVLRSLYTIRGEQMVAGRQRKRAEPRPVVPTVNRPTVATVIRPTTLDEERVAILTARGMTPDFLTRTFGYTREFVDSVVSRFADFVELNRHHYVPARDVPAQEAGK